MTIDGLLYVMLFAWIAIVGVFIFVDSWINGDPRGLSKRVLAEVIDEVADERIAQTKHLYSTGARTLNDTKAEISRIEEWREKSKAEALT